MVYHEDVECALKMVSCFFEPLGCEHKVYYDFVFFIRSALQYSLSVLGNLEQVERFNDKPKVVIVTVFGCLFVYLRFD